jgi:plastocyanin
VVDVKLKLIGIILMVLVSVMALGCVESQPSAPTSIGNSKVVSQPNPTQIQPQKNIIISYSAKKINSLGEFIEAPIGKVFLVITMNIENHGYKEFNTNPFFFKVISNNVKYDVSGYSLTIDDKLDSVNLLDGGYIKGSIAFEVPSSIENYQIQYNGWSNYEIIYKVERVEQPTQPPLRYIQINYNTQKANSIIYKSDYTNVPVNAPQGQVFLIVNIEIINSGYKEFKLNTYSFELIADKIKYAPSYYSAYLDNKLNSVTLLDGGNAKGSIAFEVPNNININDIQMQYSQGDYEIKWNSPVTLNKAAIEYTAESDKQIAVKLRTAYIDFKDKIEFFPSNVKINSGATIIWRNEDNRERRFTLISSEGLFPDKTVDYLQRYSYQFNTKGTYHFSIKEFPEVTAKVEII